MPFALVAEGFRVATLHAELTRKGPGLLLRDLERGKDKQIDALQSIIAIVAPDILLLTKVDFDLELRTAHRLRDALGFQYALAVAPNSMMPTKLDLDGNGRMGDRQSWVRYAGEGAMLLLSRHPVALKYHLNDVLWKDIPNARMPVDAKGDPFPSAQARSEQLAVSQGLWVVEIMPKHAAGITLLVFQNQTPVFDGPEDLNGLRNRAQLQLIKAVVNAEHGAFPDRRFVVVGNTNLDPNAGAGDRSEMAQFLANERLQDPHPKSEMGGEATAIWEKAGPMRVSYILPSKDWTVEQAGVFWPSEGPLRTVAEQASRHRMVWLQIRPSP